MRLRSYRAGRAGRTAGALLLLLAGCRTEGLGDIIIGAAGPLGETRGEFTRQGAELAIGEINARGGVRGRRLVLRALDDSARGSTAVAVAERHVADPEVVAVVGHVTSGAMMMAARVYDGQLAAVATAASSPELSGISPWVFRTIVSDSASAIEMARHVSQAGYRRIAILYDNDSYGRALAMHVRRNYTGEVVSADPVAAKEEDFEPFVSYYRERRPDAVIVAGAEGGGLRFLREARRQRLDATFIGANSWVGLATADPAASEGALIFAPFTPADPRPEVRRFVEAFTKAYGRAPSSHAALAYDATLAIAAAIAAVGPERAAIRDHIASISGRAAIPGVTGAIAFAPSGDRLGRGTILTRVRGGILAVGGTE